MAAIRGGKGEGDGEEGKKGGGGDRWLGLPSLFRFPACLPSPPSLLRLPRRLTK